MNEIVTKSGTVYLELMQLQDDTYPDITKYLELNIQRNPHFSLIFLQIVEIRVDD